MKRLNRHHAKAKHWIKRNPKAFGILVSRSLEHADKQEKFSIRQLCEKLRWERDNGMHKGDESYAIPNEITRYVGIEIMREHPNTEPYMTTKMPKLRARATMAQAAAMVAVAREALSGKEQKLVWKVDLRRDVGEPDAPEDPDGYRDKRWTETLERLRRAIEDMEGTEDAVTPFGMIVVCMVGVDEGKPPKPVAVELSSSHLVDLGKFLTAKPPVGKWLLMGDDEFKEKSLGREAIPDSYFIDGVPF